MRKPTLKQMEEGVWGRQGKGHSCVHYITHEGLHFIDSNRWGSKADSPIGWGGTYQEALTAAWNTLGLSLSKQTTWVVTQAGEGEPR